MSAIEKHDFVIIGGGVAGLSAGIRLAECGAQPLIIEGGSYPAHKVCGEFISSRGYDILKKWEIDPVEIRSISFHFEKKRIDFKFPEVAGSLSHLSLDPQLLRFAQNRGCSILTESRVVDVVNNQLTLSTGKIIEAKHLLVATGKMKGCTGFPYVGIKAHLKGFRFKETLEMHSFYGGYLGISPIEDEIYNVAAVVKKTLFDLFRDGQHLIHHFLGSRFQHTELLFKEWMIAPIPYFGLRKNPLVENTYFLGDAAGTIPPASGNGLSMALESGIMAADFALRGDFAGFKKAWSHRYSRPIRIGKLLHHVLMRPTLGSALSFPYLNQKIFQYTR